MSEGEWSPAYLALTKEDMMAKKTKSDAIAQVNRGRIGSLAGDAAVGCTNEFCGETPQEKRLRERAGVDKYDEDGYLRPLRQGVRTGEDDSYSIRWAVFSRADVAEEYGTLDNAALAFTLTGWVEVYRGAGKSFSHLPAVRVSRSRVLVTQTCGLDI